MNTFIAIDSGSNTAEANMLRDAQLLEELQHSQEAVLHLYDWKQASATFGHFIDPYAYLNYEGVRRQKLALARRPTGGGIIFHVSDLAFSVLVPADHEGCSLNTLENYAFVNRKVVEAIEAFRGSGAQAELLGEESPPRDAASRHFCMAKPTRYDVMLEGRKVGGAAQRRKKWGYLHQGTISLSLPEESFLEAVLRPDTEVHAAMRANTFSLLLDRPSASALEEARNHLKQCLIEAFCCCIPKQVEKRF